MTFLPIFEVAALTEVLPTDLTMGENKLFTSLSNLPIPLPLRRLSLLLNLDIVSVSFSIRIIETRGYLSNLGFST